MSELLPYDEIISIGDRSWTSRLLDRLRSGECGEDELPRVREWIRDWIGPEWKLLQFTEEELVPEPPYTAPPRKERSPGTRLPMSELVAVLADQDMPTQQLRETLVSIDWCGYGERERRQLTPLLTSHGDPLVRGFGTGALRAWSDSDSLLEMLNDADFAERKAAMYELGSVPADRCIGRVAWKHVQEPTTLGTHASETLSAFAVHAERDEAVSSLTSIVEDPSQREFLRTTALEELRKIGAYEEIIRLAPRITDPPSVTWAFHITLMDCLKQAGATCEEAEYLREVDNLDVQMSLADLL